MQSELRIQSEIVGFYNNTYCLSHHSPRCLIMAIPNGGERNKVNAMMSIAAGEYAGASDLIVIHYGEVLFIEVKTETGTQKPKQKLFQSHVEAMGFKYYIVRSVEDFKSIIEKLENREPVNPFYT